LSVDVWQGRGIRWTRQSTIKLRFPHLAASDLEKTAIEQKCLADFRPSTKSGLSVLQPRQKEARRLFEGFDQRDFWKWTFPSPNSQVMWVLQRVISQQVARDCQQWGGTLGVASLNGGAEFFDLMELKR